MTLGSSFMIAQRLLFPRALKNSTARKSILGAILCIGISIIPLVTVVSVVNGMINGMTERIISLSSNHLQAYVKRSSPFAKSYKELLTMGSAVKGLAGVKRVFPLIECDALAAGKSFRTGAHVRGIEPSMFKEYDAFERLFKVCDGSTEAFLPGKRNAIVGEKLAETLNIKAGENFTLITTKKLVNGNFVPKASVFTVSAIVSCGYQELDSLWVFVPIDIGFNVVPLENSLVSLQIETPDPFDKNLYKIQSSINRVLSGSATVFNWNELNESQFQNFASTKIMIIFVMLLIVLVAAINISSALVMLVMERRKEIAIIKSIGGSNGGITLSFLLTGTACGLAGVLTGMPVGIICAVNANRLITVLEKLVNFFSRLIFILRGNNGAEFASVKLMDPAYYLAEIPVDLPVNQFILIGISVILLSLIVSIIPAIRAGKEKPLEALRKS